MSNWLDRSAGGVLAIKQGAEMRMVLELHILLLDGQTWAYWSTAGGTWLGMARVGMA